MINKNEWTHENHPRWGDYVIKDSRGWTVCVVGTEKEADLIVTAVNEHRKKLLTEKRG
jgi:hypothetical protein